MAFFVQAPLFALFFLTAFSRSLAVPWNSSPFDKPGRNPSFEEMLWTSGETFGRPSRRPPRRKNTFTGSPCGLCGQVIFGSEALNHHYNYHFLQNELASLNGRSDPCSGGSHRPPLWNNYLNGQTSASREPQMTLSDYLATPTLTPSLRRYSGAGAVDMAHLLPLHPLLAQPPPPPPPRSTADNGTNVRQNQTAGGQRRQGNQVRWNNGGGRVSGVRPAAENQPAQDVIDLNREENDCSSDGSEGLDLTLSL